MLAAVLVLSACSASDEASRPPGPAMPPVLEVSMDEYRYGAPAAVPAGRVVFRLRNRGDQAHQPILVALPDDFPPMAEHLKQSVTRNVETVASNPGFRPGISGAIAVDLEAGKRYAFLCSLRTADGKRHDLLGMAWEFTAGGEAAAPATAPAP